MKYPKTRLFLFSLGVVFFLISVYAPIGDGQVIFVPLSGLYLLVSIFGKVKSIFDHNENKTSRK